jgi:hypothetical protein
MQIEIVERLDEGKNTHLMRSISNLARLREAFDLTT